MKKKKWKNVQQNRKKAYLKCYALDLVSCWWLDCVLHNIHIIKTNDFRALFVIQWWVWDTRNVYMLQSKRFKREIELVILGSATTSAEKQTFKKKLRAFRWHFLFNQIYYTKTHSINKFSLIKSWAHCFHPL